MKQKLSESLETKVGKNLKTRRYNLSDMISESYKTFYACEKGSNLQRLAEAHINDVRTNPTDTERLSRQLCMIKEALRLVESGKIKDKDLVDKEKFDTVDPRKERVIQESRPQRVFNYEIWYDGNCIREETGFEDPEEAEYEAQDGIAYIIDNEEGYEDCTPDEFEVKITDNYEETEPYIPEDDDFDECDEPKKGKRLNDLKDSIDEADSPELTDEEVEELAKHLEEIRKGKKPVTEECDPKKEVEESVVPKKGIKVSSKRESKKEVEESVVPKKGIKVSSKRESKKEDLTEDRDPDYELQNMISESISNALYSVFESNGLDPEDDSLMQDFYYAVNIDDLVYDTAKFIEGRSSKVVKESKSYRGLSNFKKLSESKAFYKTFKKLDTKLREGRALTRQESIDLYKASNSALTQLSIELEHNPEFLDTFKECTTILSKDVQSLLESLKEGKAPSKKTMKSLSKFSEALLNESWDSARAYDVSKYCLDKGYDIDQALRVIKNQLKKEGSKLPDNDKEIMQVIYSVYDEIDESTTVKESEGEEAEVADTEDSYMSEEAEEFDQEYADARKELHDELADKYEDSEDPEVQDKLEADRVDVAILNGEDPYEEESAEEETPSEEDPVEDEDIEDSLNPEDDITPDELAELKKHLKEMRSAKKLSEA